MINVKIKYLIFVITLTSCLNNTKNHNPKTEEWYVGGDLHKAKISKWKSSTEKNKLATCGDFLAYKHQGKSLEFIRIKADDLRVCINEATRDHNLSDGYDVAEVASMCIILLEN